MKNFARFFKFIHHFTSTLLKTFNNREYIKVFEMVKTWLNDNDKTTVIYF